MMEQLERPLSLGDRDCYTDIAGNQNVLVRIKVIKFIPSQPYFG